MLQSDEFERSSLARYIFRHAVDSRFYSQIRRSTMKPEGLLVDAERLDQFYLLDSSSGVGCCPAQPHVEQVDDLDAVCHACDEAETTLARRGFVRSPFTSRSGSAWRRDHCDRVGRCLPEQAATARGAIRLEGTHVTAMKGGRLRYVPMAGGARNRLIWFAWAA